MRYPTIMNGDHAEFEREYVNAEPEDRPDWPLPSFDARDWAKAFMKIYEAGVVVDQELMTTWFANALMRGFDERGSLAKTAARLASAIDECAINPKGGKMAAIAYRQCARWIREKIVRNTSTDSGQTENEQLRDLLRRAASYGGIEPQLDIEIAAALRHITPIIKPYGAT